MLSRTFSNVSWPKAGNTLLAAILTQKRCARVLRPPAKKPCPSATPPSGEQGPRSRKDPDQEAPGLIQELWTRRAL